MKLTFDHALVTRLLAHSCTATTHSPNFEQLYDPKFLKDGITTRDPSHDDIDTAKVPPGLWLVGDQGVYLMSNGLPDLKAENGKGALIALAAETDPARHPESWHDAKRRSFGGDDGCDFIAADAIAAALEATRGGAFCLNLSPGRLSLPALAAAKKPKAKAPPRR